MDRLTLFAQMLGHPIHSSFISSCYSTYSIPFIIVNIFFSIMMSFTGIGFLILGFVAVANAHTTFTTLYVDRKSQGDGTCVRMPYDGETATFPIKSVVSEDMVCGKPGSLLASNG